MDVNLPLAPLTARLFRCCISVQEVGSPTPHKMPVLITIASIRNLPKHPQQIRLMQSRPQAFVRMCRQAALTALRLICTNTMAGCDGIRKSNKQRLEK